MAKKETEIILTQPVISLNAHEGDQVKVSPGYARNFLLPQGKAIPASAGNQRYIEALKANRAEREAEELDHMKDLYESLKSLRLHIKVKTGEEGKMFGSVTSGTICDELKNQFDVELEKKRVHLPKAIKKVGEFDVKLNLHTEIEAELKVFVESENSMQTAAEEASDTSVVG
ncbi:MAG: 50S ribosomal protein L9 [Verrucomicrobiota bacterium]|nr:50S ribosomal protein L9 [Verrucomicrobiota bacterium]